MTGRVSLVGAGPGDPELLTLRAIRRLDAADLVLYDALIDSDTLQFAPRARRFFVGKRAGRPAITQDAINRLMPPDGDKPSDDERRQLGEWLACALEAANQ